MSYYSDFTSSIKYYYNFGKGSFSNLYQDYVDKNLFNLFDWVSDTYYSFWYDKYIHYKPIKIKGYGQLKNIACKATLVQLDSNQEFYKNLAESAPAETNDKVIIVASDFGYEYSIKTDELAKQELKQQKFLIASQYLIFEYNFFKKLEELKTKKPDCFNIKKINAELSNYFYLNDVKSSDEFKSTLENFCNHNKDVVSPICVIFLEFPEIFKIETEV